MNRTQSHMHSKSDNTYRLIATALNAVLLACSVGCGSGGDSGATPPPVTPPPPVTDIHTVKGIDFDSLTSTQTDGSLIAIPTASFTTVQSTDTTFSGNFTLPASPQTQWYDVSASSVASDLIFSQTILPCTKLTLMRSNVNAGVLSTVTVSYYFAKAVSGDTYLMKKIARSGVGQEIVFDLTGVGSAPLLVAPKDPVVGSVCFLPVVLGTLAPSNDIAAVGGTCTLAGLNATSPQGVTGCVRLRRNGGYQEDLYVKPGVGIVWWSERLNFSTNIVNGQKRTGLVGSS